MARSDEAGYSQVLQLACRGRCAQACRERAGGKGMYQQGSTRPLPPCGGDLPASLGESPACRSALCTPAAWARTAPALPLELWRDVFTHLEPPELGAARATCRAFDAVLRRDPVLSVRATLALGRARRAAILQPETRLGAAAARTELAQHLACVGTKVAMRDALSFWAWQARHAERRSFARVEPLWWQLTPVLQDVLGELEPAYARLLRHLGSGRAAEELGALRLLPLLDNAPDYVTSAFAAKLSDAAAHHLELQCMLAHLLSRFDPSEVEAVFGDTPFSRAIVVAQQRYRERLELVRANSGVVLAPIDGSPLRRATLQKQEVHCSLLRASPCFGSILDAWLRGRPEPGRPWPMTRPPPDWASDAPWRTAWRNTLLWHFAGTLSADEVRALAAAPAYAPQLVRCAMQFDWALHWGPGWRLGTAGYAAYVRAESALYGKLFLSRTVPPGWWAELFELARNDGAERGADVFAALPDDVHGQLAVHGWLWARHGTSWGAHVDAFAAHADLRGRWTMPDAALLRPDQNLPVHREATFLALAHLARPAKLSGG